MNDTKKNSVIYKYLNQIRYKEALQIQESAIENIRQSKSRAPGYLYLLEHYPVITNGRFSKDDNYLLPLSQITQMGVEVFNTERGGDLTYHGPGQLVSYPIIDLRTFKLGAKAYINSLEQVIINLLSDFEIDSYRRESYPGVWTNNQKIASIGVAVKNGITMHGSALNVSTDLDAFSMIVPCGINDVVVTSMEKTLGSAVNMKDVTKSFINQFRNVFNAQII